MQLPREVENFIRKKVLKLKNVNGYSKTLKPRIKGGKVVNSEMCIRIYVEKKVPVAQLSLADVIPTEIMGYKTDVCAIDHIVAQQDNPKKRYRPLVAGISAMHYQGTACTLGLAFKDAETGEVLLAQNNHCAALENKANIGDPILQPSCFPPGSLIITNFGIKTIENIKDGEVVLGNGKFVKVLNTMKRQFNGKIVKIKPYRFLEFELTSEHPLLVIETNGFRNGQERRHQLLDSQPTWKAAKDLSRNDFLLIPRIKECRKAEPLEIIRYRYYCKECRHSWRTYNRPRRPTCSRCKSKKVEDKGIEKKVIDVNDPDFGFIVGLFVADGSAQTNSVSFNLSKDDKWFIEKTKWLLKKLFGNCKMGEYGNVARVYYNNKVVCEWFKENCYLDREKKLPDFGIYMDGYWIRELIEGLLAGDGCRDRKFGEMFTTSKVLAYQLSTLLAKIGVLPSVKTVYENRERVRDGKVIKEKEGFRIVCLERHRQRRGYILPNYVALQIEKVNLSDYSGTVYNMETEDNTYAVPFIVHNCYDGGVLPDDKVGELYKFVPISFEEFSCPFRRFVMRFVRFFHKAAPNKADVGFFKPSVEWKQEVLDKGAVVGKCVPEIGDKVWKVGRTTGFTEGTVSDLDWAGYVSYSRGTAFFEDCILVEGYKFSQGGDSSSPVQKGNLTVGMLFAGSDTHTIVCKIDNIEAIGKVKLILPNSVSSFGVAVPKKGDDPVITEIVSLRERVARLEQKSENMEDTLKTIKERLEKLGDRVWYVLSGVILSILLQILLRVLH